MKSLPQIALAAFVFAILSTQISAAPGEVFVRQVNHARHGAYVYVAQVGGPSVRIRIAFSKLYGTANVRPQGPDYPIPAYAFPRLNRETALGFFLNSNRRQLDEHERIFRDFLR
jgi:hypothetical protein